jgi:hypothetical protein
MAFVALRVRGIGHSTTHNWTGLCMAYYAYLGNEGKSSLSSFELVPEGEDRMPA